LSEDRRKFLTNPFVAIPLFTAPLSWKPIDALLDGKIELAGGLAIAAILVGLVILAGRSMRRAVGSVVTLFWSACLIALILLQTSEPITVGTAAWLVISFLYLGALAYDFRDYAIDKDAAPNPEIQPPPSTDPEGSGR
jgi:hypothetical protein